MSAYINKNYYFFLVFLPLYPRPLGLVFAWAAFFPYYVLIDYGLSGVWKEDFMLTSVVFLTAASAFAAGMFRGRNKFTSPKSYNSVCYHQSQ